jgi:surfeit locus 1 family protein
MSNYSLFGNNYYFTSKFSKLAFFLVALFIGLGIWQLSVAHYNKTLIAKYNERVDSQAIQANSLQTPADWRYYPIQLQGSFDNEHQILLARRSPLGDVGYEVLTPFKSLDLATGMLVNRGWVPANNNPDILPNINSSTENVSISGLLVSPKDHEFSFNNIDKSKTSWPLIIDHISLDDLSKMLGYPLYSYIVLLGPNNPNGYAREWQPTASLMPEHNIIQALRFLSVALTIAILFILINLHRRLD